VRRFVRYGLSLCQNDWRSTDELNRLPVVASEPRIGPSITCVTSGNHGERRLARVFQQPVNALTL
jgi:hypothetical protein